MSDAPEVPDTAVEAFLTAIDDWSTGEPHHIKRALAAAAPELTRQAVAAVEREWEAAYNDAEREWGERQVKAVAAERERIATALAKEERAAHDDYKRERDTYQEGRRDAYDHAESIARAEPGTDERTDHE